MSISKLEQPCQCIYCRQDECEWKKLGDCIRQLSRVMEHENNRCPCHLYRFFIERKYVMLGRYDGLWIPWCVEIHIMAMYPYQSNFFHTLERLKMGDMSIRNNEQRW